MTWDKTKPQGTELVSLGDDRIRELKQDLREILGVEHYFPINNNNPVALHKFALLTTAQEVNTRNGQIWYNTELKQLSYKIANTIKRFSRYIPTGFNFLMLWAPNDITSFWKIKASQQDYVLGITKGNPDSYSGSNFWSVVSIHTVSVFTYIHSHSVFCSFGSASGQNIGMSVGSGSKLFKKGEHNQDYHHASATYYTPEITLLHTHSLQSAGWTPSYIEGFFMERL